MRRRFAWLQPWRLPMAWLVAAVVVGAALVLVAAEIDAMSIGRPIGYVAIVWGVLGAAGRILVRAVPVPFDEPRD